MVPTPTSPIRDFCKYTNYANSDQSLAARIGTTAKRVFSSLLLCGAIGAFAPTVATAAVLYSEGFESYSAGTSLDGVGGWAGWDGVSSAAGTVTDAEKRSGSNSIIIDGSTDAVRLFTPTISTGLVRLDAWMLLEQTDHTALTYFIVNNIYNHGGPYAWAISLEFDNSNGQVNDDKRVNTPASIKYDDWALISILLDLDNDLQTTYYDGQLMSMDTMTADAGPAEIAAINLYSAGAISYFDDISITEVPRPTPPGMMIPEPGTLALFGIGLAGLAFARRRKTA